MSISLYAGQAGERTAAEKLSRIIITGVAVLSPVFFAVMYQTVTTLVRPWFGWWAWTVPVATEGSFVLLYLMSIRLEMAARPWLLLRLAPYPFAAGSLWLNVYAGRAHTADMVSHGMITIAFFVPLLAGETVLRRLRTSDDDVSYAAELADARACARDLLRDRLGVFWRARMPALLRRQLRSGRLPAEVIAAIRAGASYGGATAWQPAVRDWITESLTGATRPDATQPDPVRTRESQRETGMRLLRDGRPVDEVAAETGATQSTVYRWKQKLRDAA